MAGNVIHNGGQHRFEVKADGYVAILEYQQGGDRLTLTHTRVPNSVSGKGVGSSLVRFALDYAREHGLRVVPQCPFVANFIERHREYQDLVVS